MERQCDKCKQFKPSNFSFFTERYWQCFDCIRDNVLYSVLKNSKENMKNINNNIIGLHDNVINHIDPSDLNIKCINISYDKDSYLNVINNFCIHESKVNDITNIIKNLIERNKV